MPTPIAAASASEGLFRFSGMYGSAWRDGKQLAEVTEVSGAVTLNRIDVPLVGLTKVGYKPGRETREGTMRIQKIDTKWEMELYRFLSAGLHQRRIDRDAGRGSLRPFSLLLEYDDPATLGIEKWQIDGCLLWHLPLGFSIGDDLVEREYPLTWETERPIYAFRAEDSGAGTPAAVWYTDPSGAPLGPPPPTA
jgi:hypothetical protein